MAGAPTNEVLVTPDGAGVVGMEGDTAEGEAAEAEEAAVAAVVFPLQEEVEGEEGEGVVEEEVAVGGTDGAAREAMVAEEGVYPEVAGDRTAEEAEATEEAGAVLEAAEAKGLAGLGAVGDAPAVVVVVAPGVARVSSRCFFSKASFFCHSSMAQTCRKGREETGRKEG